MASDLIPSSATNYLVEWGAPILAVEGDTEDAYEMVKCLQRLCMLYTI